MIALIPVPDTEIGNAPQFPVMAALAHTIVKIHNIRVFIIK
jgi:hypothetical protein